MKYDIFGGKKMPCMSDLPVPSGAPLSSLIMLSLSPSRAHWYLAVICFPGLEGPKLEPNPLYQPQAQAQTQTQAQAHAHGISRGSPTLDRLQPSLAQDALVPSGPANPSPPPSVAPVACPAGPAAASHQHKAMPLCPHLPQDNSCSHNINGQLKVQPQYTGKTEPLGQRVTWRMLRYAEISNKLVFWEPRL